MNKSPNKPSEEIKKWRLWLTIAFAVIAINGCTIIYLAILLGRCR